MSRLLRKSYLDKLSYRTPPVGGVRYLGQKAEIKTRFARFLTSDLEVRNDRKRLKVISKLTCLIISLFVLFVCLSSAYASVVLNEVAIQPNQAVELYNTASTSADISSWYIDDSGGTTYFTIPSQTILPSKSCLLFSSDFNFNKSSTDIIRLFDNTSPPTSSSAQLVEQYSYAKAPEINYSFSKKMDGGTEWQTVISSLGLSNESLLSCIPVPTPTSSPTTIPVPPPTTATSPTSQPTQIPSSASIADYQNIFISEVYPYPSPNENEWIELYNGNDMQVHLDHWYIDDVENGGSAPKSFSLTIDPYTYGVVNITSSLFNNGGDIVRLLDNDKNEKDSMEYGKIVQGKSMGRISFMEDFYCGQEPTKNTVNSSCLPIPISQTSSPSPSAQKTTASTQKKPLLVKNSSINRSPRQINTATNTVNTPLSQQEGEILGTQANKAQQTSPIPYLSSVSFSYSLLTIVSLFIKMKNA